MKTATSVGATLTRRRTTVRILLAALLAVAIGAGLSVWMDAMYHATASEAHPSASGFATQDLDGSQAQATGGQAMRDWAERCAGMADTYHFDRHDLTYTTGDGALRAGGRISLYLITEDDDEYAPLPCRLLTAYMAGS
jgi:hypothetical protein